MKKKASLRHREGDRDTMRPEYDYSAAVRGVTAAITPRTATPPPKTPSAPWTR